MKHLPWILVLTFLSCNSGKDKTLEFLNEGIERTSNHTEILNENFLTSFEAAYQINRRKTEPYKSKADQLNKLSSAIFKSIDERKTGILNKNPENNEIQKNVLFSNIGKYKHLIDSIFPNDTIIQLQSQSLIGYNKSLLDELNLFQLNLIKNKINNINYLAFANLNSKIDRASNKFNKNEIVIIPKSKYLYKDELYQSHIQIISIDTTAEYWAMVNGDKIESAKGKVLYIDKNTSFPKIVNKKAVLQIQSPATDEILTFPFSLKYQITDK